MAKRWSVYEVARLKDWAGKRRASEIAADLGRPKAATFVKAHQLKVSLKVRPSSIDPGPTGMDLTG